MRFLRDYWKQCRNQPNKDMSHYTAIIVVVTQTVITPREFAYTRIPAIQLWGLCHVL